MITKTKYFKKGNSRRQIFFYSLLGILWLAVMIFLLFTDLRINRKKKELDSQLSVLKEEIQILEEKNKLLKAEVSKEGTESFLEEEARERLGLKKPGEEVVVILPSEEKQEIAQTAPASSWQTFQKKANDFLQKLLQKLNLRD